MTKDDNDYINGYADGMCATELRFADDGMVTVIGVGWVRYQAGYNAAITRRRKAVPAPVIPATGNVGNSNN